MWTDNVDYVKMQVNGEDILAIYNDYDVGAVYLKSEMDLSKVFN